MLLDLYGDRLGPYPAPRLETVPKSFGDRFSIEFDAARAPDDGYFYERNSYGKWESAIESLYRATGTRVPNPYGPLIREPGQPAEPDAQRARAKALDVALTAFGKARGDHPDLPDPTQFDSQIAAEATELRRKAALADATDGFTLSTFLGGAAGTLSHPVQAASLLIGAPEAVGVGAARGLLTAVATRALRAGAIEGAIAGGTQGAIEAAANPVRQRLGTSDQTDPWMNVVVAAGGAFLLGAGGRAIADALRGGKVAVSQEVTDAVRTVERAERDTATSPFPADNGAAHIDNLGIAADAARLGDRLQPGGPFSLLHPVVRDTGLDEMRVLRAQRDELARSLDVAGPRMASDRQALLARVDAVEAQLAKPGLTAEESRALSRRRDELLADTTPEALRKELADTQARIATENRIASIDGRLGQMTDERFSLNAQSAAALPKATTEALTEAGDKLNALTDAVKAGTVPPRMNASPYLGAALDVTARAKAAKTSVAEIMAREPWTLSPEGFAFLRLLHADDALTRPASKTAIARRLAGYADEAAKMGHEVEGATQGAAALLDDGAGRRAQMATDMRAAAEAQAKPEAVTALMADVERLLAEKDLDIPGEIVVRDGVEQATKTSARELLESVKEAARVAKEVMACALGGGASE